jgi:hypothetical protein
MHYFLCHVDLDVPNDVWATSRPLLTVQWQVGHLPLSHLQWWKYRRYPYPRSLAPPPFTCSPVVESPPHLFGLCAPRCSLSRVFLCLCLSAPHLSSLLFYALLPKGSSLLPLLVVLFITVFTGRPLLPCGVVRFVSSLFLDASFLAFFLPCWDLVGSSCSSFRSSSSSSLDLTFEASVLRTEVWRRIVFFTRVCLVPHPHPAIRCLYGVFLGSTFTGSFMDQTYCVFYSCLLDSSSSSCNSVSLRCFFRFGFLRSWFLPRSNILRFSSWSILFLHIFFFFLCLFLSGASSIKPLHLAASPSWPRYQFSLPPSVVTIAPWHPVKSPTIDFFCRLLDCRCAMLYL